MTTKVETARTMVYKSAWLLDQGKPDTKLTAMAKLYACHVAIEVVDETLQLHGGYGYFNDYDVERFYRAAKVLEIYEGTKKIEKIVISNALRHLFFYLKPPTGRRPTSFLIFSFSASILHRPQVLPSHLSALILQL
jgi:alkylation response protein AidB-like acyl-CoA dehydrogenase